MAEKIRKSELIAELARSRETISGSFQGLGRELNVVRRAERSISQNKLAWIGGASILGFLLAKLPARTRKVVVDKSGRSVPQSAGKAAKAGLIVTLLKLAFDVARPALTKWATQRVADFAQQRFTPPS